MNRLLIGIALVFAYALAAVQAQGLPGGAAFVPGVAALTDITGMPVPDTEVEWRGPRGSLLRAKSDRQGIARVALPAAETGTWTVRASGPGFLDATATFDLEVTSGSPASPPRLEMEIRRLGEALLEVHVRDVGGKPVPNVPIDAQHQRALDAFALGSGPRYQGMTGPDGVARIAVKPGRSFGERMTGTELRVTAKDPKEGAPDARAAVSKLVTFTYDVPRKVVDLILLDASADTVNGMPVRVTVLAEDKGVPGASVVLHGRDLSERRPYSTDAQGQAIVEATVIFAGRFGIEVTKNGYAPGRGEVSLDPRDRGKKVEEVTVVLKPLPPAVGALPLSVEVRDRAGQVVIGAAVRLTPKSGDSSPLVGVTGTDGIAPLVSNASGPWQLVVSHDLFVTHRSDVQLERKEEKLQVRLDASPREKEEDSTLTVFVTAVDRKDKGGRALPLGGAMLRWGNSSMGTDDQGKASISFTGQLGLNFSVEAPGYKPAHGSVDGGRYGFVRQHTRRVQLEPAEVTDDSPFTLLIRTEEDAEPFAPMPQVAFRLLLSDGRSIGEFRTGADGEVTIGVLADTAALARRGLTVVVEATPDHAADRETIPAQLLLPSPDPSRYSVQLTSFFARDLASLNAEVTRLEALKRDFLKKLDDAWDDHQGIKDLSDAVKAVIDARFGGKKPATPFKQMQLEADQACDRAARSAREHVRSSDALANDALKSIEAAQREAAACTSLGAAGRIDAGQQAVLRTLDELRIQSRRARQDSKDFLQKAADLEQEADDPLAKIREYVDLADRSAARAAVRMPEARADAARLRKGHADATARLNALRARKTLTPAQSAQTLEPGRRLAPLLTHLEPPNDPETLAKADAGRLKVQLKELEAWAGSFGKSGCIEARVSYPRSVDTVEANLAALDFTLARADLPGLAQQCRVRVAANDAVAAQTAAAAAMVTVPDLSVVGRHHWAQAVQSAGLSWVGELVAGAATPSASLAHQLAYQSLPAGSRVQRGVQLYAFVWGPYRLPPGPVQSETTTPPNPPAPPSIAASAPPGPLPWEQMLRAAAAAAPAIAAAIQQNRARPSPPAAVQPALPAGPTTTGGVPYVLGDSLEQAQRKLQASGLFVRGISRGGKPPSPELSGRVYHQNPAAGSALGRDLAVDLMVYDNDRSTVTPATPPAGGTTRYDRPTQGGLPIHQCATAGPWPNGDCGNEGAEYFCTKYKGHQRVFGFKTYAVSQSFRLKDGTRCVQGQCPAFLEVVCQ